MKQYKVTYSKIINLVLAMTLPCLLIIPAIILMARYLPDLPDWAVGSIITVLMLLIIGIALKATFSMISKGVLILNDDGFVVEFTERKRFTPESFEIKIADITRFKPHIENANFYMSFTTTVAPGQFTISGNNNRDAEDMATFLELMQTIAQMVEEKTNENIKYK